MQRLPKFIQRYFQIIGIGLDPRLKTKLIDESEDQDNYEIYLEPVHEKFRIILPKRNLVMVSNGRFMINENEDHSLYILNNDGTISPQDNLDKILFLKKGDKAIPKIEA